MSAQDRFTWQAGDIQFDPPKREQRDWTEWDLEHPYIPHPRPEHSLAPASGVTNDEHFKAVNDIVTSKLSMSLDGKGGDEYVSAEAREDAKQVVARDVAAGIYAANGTKFDEQMLMSGYVNTASGGPVTADMLDENHYLQKMDSGSVVIGTWLDMFVPLVTGSLLAADLAKDPGSRSNSTGSKVRGDTPEAAQMVREAATAGMVHQWAMTSNDSDPESIAMQNAAEREFGLKGAAEWVTPSDAPLSFESKVKDAEQSNGALYQAFLRAQYDNTQKTLAAAGITELSLHRGQYAVTDAEKEFVAGHEAGTADEMEMQTRPLSSWSTNRLTAVSFSGTVGGGGYVASATVPADRILSTPITGNGCLSEFECVVLGGTDKVNAESRGADELMDAEVEDPEYDKAEFKPVPMDMGQAKLGKDQYGNSIK